MKMIRIEMEFYATKTPDGKIHVQNVINGLRGQHHVHSAESFERWSRHVNPGNLEIDEGECGCGLEVGQVREYDGRVWFNDRFLRDEPAEVEKIRA